MQIRLSDSSDTDVITLLVEIVEEVVDDPPEFLRSRYSFPVIENAADGTTVGHVPASDDGQYI